MVHQGGDGWVLCTVWVGGISKAAATEDNLDKVLSRVGRVHSVVVRLKPGADTCRNWGLVSFNHERDARKAVDGDWSVPLAARDWTIKPLHADQMKSLEANMIRQAAVVKDPQSATCSLWPCSALRCRLHCRL